MGRLPKLPGSESNTYDADLATKGPVTTSQLGHARSQGGAPPWHHVPQMVRRPVGSQATYWVKVILIIREPFKQEATWRRENRFQEEEQEGTGIAPESQLRYFPNSYFHLSPWKITGQMHSLTQTESSRGTPSASAIHSC